MDAVVTETDQLTVEIHRLALVIVHRAILEERGTSAPGSLHHAPQAPLLAIRVRDGIILGMVLASTFVKREIQALHVPEGRRVDGVVCARFYYTSREGIAGEDVCVWVRNVFAAEGPEGCGGCCAK